MKKLFIASSALLISVSFATAQDAVTSTPQASATPAIPRRTAETERVVVTASALEHSETETVESVSVLNGEDLKRRAGANLGDTLGDQPGVASSGFTAGAGRPVIRGLSDNRVRVLNNGTEVFDVSNLSPDHAPSVNPLLSSSIEVVRGPATILYGSGAIGGVVNVNDTRIPVEAPPTLLSGETVARFGSVDLERSSALSLQLAATKHIVLHGDFSILRTDDRAIPGFALSDRLRAQLTPEQAAGRGFGENPEGIVPNTYVRTKEYGFGASYVWDGGYLGVSYSEFLSIYGVPQDPAATLAGDPQVPVHLDLDKRQFNLRSSLVDPIHGIPNANFKFVYTDYEHQEIDKDIVGSTFKTSGTDSRVEIVHQPIGRLQGSFGGQVLSRNLSVLGENPFLQPTQTLQLAAFLFEEAKLGPVRLQGGVRIEYDAVDIDTADPVLTSLTSPSQQHPDFLPLSAALGAIYTFANDYALSFNGSYSQRAPTAEELFARGLHDATFQYIIGDPNLGVEKSIGIDLSLRKQTGVVTGSVSAFYNRFRDFIAFTPTADFVEDTRVFDYTPRNAQFYGGEAQVQFHLLPLTLAAADVPAAPPDSKSVRRLITGEKPEVQKNPHDLWLDLRGDYVRAEDTNTSEPLPRITPLRYSASLNYRSAAWEAQIEGQRVNRQNRVAEFETATPGYTFLNASVGYNFHAGPVLVNVYLRGTNLTNEEARDHLSFLKDVLPLAGRSVLAGLRTTF
ncbi:MAG: TonB-dependent receptor [Chthoniobacterales bacterium]